MFKQTLAGTVGLMFLAASAAPAIASDGRFTTVRDNNSLQTCEAAIRSEIGSGEIRETYHDRGADGGHMIYANVRTWEDGKLTNTRVTCQTSDSGMRLQALNTASGRWVESQDLAYGLSQN